MSKRKIESIKELREICQHSEANRDSWYDVIFSEKYQFILQNYC